MVGEDSQGPIGDQFCGLPPSRLFSDHPGESPRYTGAF